MAGLFSGSTQCFFKLHSIQLNPPGLLLALARIPREALGERARRAIRGRRRLRRYGEQGQLADQCGEYDQILNHFLPFIWIPDSSLEAFRPFVILVSNPTPDRW